MAQRTNPETDEEFAEWHAQMMRSIKALFVLVFIVDLHRPMGDLRTRPRMDRRVMRKLLPETIEFEVIGTDEAMRLLTRVVRDDDWYEITSGEEPEPVAMVMPYQKYKVLLDLIKRHAEGWQVVVEPHDMSFWWYKELYKRFEQMTDDERTTLQVITGVTPAGRRVDRPDFVRHE